MAKNVIPKKVAGFKIPKSLRKSKMLRTLLNSDVGRPIVASALTAGAAAAAEVLMREREEIADAAKGGVKRGMHTAELIGEAFRGASHAAMGVVADAAQSVLPKQKSQKRNESTERYN